MGEEGRLLEVLDLSWAWKDRLSLARWTEEYGAFWVGEGPRQDAGGLCGMSLWGSQCKQMLSYGNSAAKMNHLRDHRCWWRSGLVGAVGMEEGWGKVLTLPVLPWAVAGHILIWGVVSPTSSCFFPSFPAEGNNLSPEQIKSDLHEI